MLIQYRKLIRIHRDGFARLVSLFGLLLCQPIYAAEDLKISKWSYQLGVDTWQLNASVEQDPAPWNAQNTNLLLPNAATNWNYADTSPYAAVIGNQYIQNHTFFSLKAKADQAKGLRVDEAMLQHDISPSFGFRVGVVNYKTSWCRTYEPDNGWIREVETVCLTKSLRDVTGGAPGAQAFTSSRWGNYLVQNQIGFYRPLAFNYAPKEFGNYTPSPNFQVAHNHKIGFNINVLHLDKAFETRLSYIRANQRATLPEDNIRGAAPQTSDLWYLGVAIPVTNKLNVRLTQFMQHQNIECWSQLDTAPWCNTRVTQQKTATALELSYRITSVDLLSIGMSDTKLDTDRRFYTVQRTFADQDFPFYIRTRQFSAAWRHDWPNGVFGLAQFLLAKQKNAFDDMSFSSHGNALGLRIGYQY